jgi:thiamine biosynthesis lipoprotein
MNLFKNKSPINYAILIFSFLLIFSCSQEKNYNAKIKGNTMGTYYFIEIIDVPVELKIKNIELEIKNTLKKANKILSNWDKDSEISIINKTDKTTAIKISDELNEVFKTAKEINAKSNGFFDLTLDPIIELWGFGYKSKQMQIIPKDNQIKNILSLIGQKSFLKMNFDNNELIKKNKDIKINLSSIGKGYGIDLIGKKLDQLGINNYIINIGGDILTKGYNSKKENWVIGIENPNLKEKFIKEIVNLTNKGLATSGDYKNFFTKDGKRYSHIINPKTGKPIKHSTKSVTVIHENSMKADGWATAFLALGSLEGLKIADKEKIAVLFIDEIDNKLIKFKSSAFKNLK